MELMLIALNLFLPNLTINLLKIQGIFPACLAKSFLPYYFGKETVNPSFRHFFKGTLFTAFS